MHVQVIDLLPAVRAVIGDDTKSVRDALFSCKPRCEKKHFTQQMLVFRPCVGGFAIRRCYVADDKPADSKFQGAVVQGNFDDYEPLRMSEMPEVSVHRVQSTEAPGGIGEPGLPPIAPAVANALFALTGERLRRLPLRPSARAG